MAKNDWIRTCNVCLFPLQSCFVSLLWCFLHVFQVQQTFLCCLGDVLLLALWRLRLYSFGWCPWARWSLTSCRFNFGHAGSVEQWHPGVRYVLPLEVTALQRFVRDEVEAPAFGRLLQVFTQSGPVLHLELFSVHWAEQAASGGPSSPQGTQDALVSCSHDSALKSKKASG